MNITISKDKVNNIITEQLCLALEQLTNHYQITIDYNKISNNIINKLKEYEDIY